MKWKKEKMYNIFMVMYKNKFVIYTTTVFIEIYFLIMHILYFICWNIQFIIPMTPNNVYIWQKYSGDSYAPGDFILVVEV